jgi:hypothetical protein
MGRHLVRLADGSDFRLRGEGVNRSPTPGHAVLFIVTLGGPHERHGTSGPEVCLLLDPVEA